MKQIMAIEEIEREQEKLDLEKERLGVDTGFNDEEKWLLEFVKDRDKKLNVGLGTMITGRLLFGKFSR